jgi:hypothetical protein
MFGSSTMSERVESGIIRGGPFGGVTIMAKNELRKFTQTVISDERFAIVKIDDYLIVDVYLPCVVTNDRKSIVENILADICYHVESFNNWR